jgi:hypothetical protein
MPSKVPEPFHRNYTWDSIVFGDGGQCVPLSSPRTAVSLDPHRIRRGLGLNEFRLSASARLPEPARRRAADHAFVPADRDSIERAGRPTARSTRGTVARTPPNHTPRAFGRETQNSRSSIVSRLTTRF